MREYIERNGSAKHGSKTSYKREAYPYLRGTIPYKTVPNFTFKRNLNAVYVALTAV